MKPLTTIIVGIIIFFVESIVIGIISLILFFFDAKLISYLWSPILIYGLSLIIFGIGKIIKLTGAGSIKYKPITFTKEQEEELIKEFHDRIINYGDHCLKEEGIKTIFAGNIGEKRSLIGLIYGYGYIPNKYHLLNTYFLIKNFNNKNPTFLVREKPDDISLHEINLIIEKMVEDPEKETTTTKLTVDEFGQPSQEIVKEAVRKEEQTTEGENI